MAVFIFQPDAYDLMTQVEGQDWRTMQDEGKFGPHSFSAFLQLWHDKAEPLSEDARKAYGYLGFSDASTIYGRGGWTRYLVHYTGELVFHERQSPSAEVTRKAQAAGFTIGT